MEGTKAKNMRIEKIINNNAISTLDEMGREIILMGKGIGFQKKPGDPVVTSKIEKRFRMDNSTESYKLEELFKDTPIEHIQIATKCTEYAKKHLDKKLNSSIYITLIDHLNLAIERKKQGMTVGNRLLWDIKGFYPDEYNVASYALALVKEQLGVELSEDEAGFLTMHFVNAELDGAFPDTMNITKFMNNIFSIIKEYYQITIEPGSDQYNRFVAHLKYLGGKVFSGKADSMEDDDQEFHNMIKLKYKKAYLCVQKIETYIEEVYHFMLAPDEEMYLIIYVQRMIMDLSSK